MAYTIRLPFWFLSIPLHELVGFILHAAGLIRILWQGLSFVLGYESVECLSWQRFRYQVLIIYNFISYFFAFDNISWGHHALYLNRHRALIRTAGDGISPRRRCALPKSALTRSESVLLESDSAHWLPHALQGRPRFLCQSYSPCTSG